MLHVVVAAAGKYVFRMRTVYCVLLRGLSLTVHRWMCPYGNRVSKLKGGWLSSCTSVCDHKMEVS